MNKYIVIGSQVALVSLVMLIGSYATRKWEFSFKNIIWFDGKLDYFSKDKGKIHKFSGWLRIVSNLTPFVHIVVVTSKKKKKKGDNIRFKSVSILFSCIHKKFWQIIKMFYQKFNQKKILIFNTAWNCKKFFPINLLKLKFHVVENSYRK